MKSSDALAGETLAHLERLVAFDTTSSKSNLPLLDYAADHLSACGARLRRVSGGPEKASLIATLGPEGAGGIVLSGHSDVVPVDGQLWSTDPWTLTRKDDGRLYGRGTSDMKSFIALALAIAPELGRATLQRPVHIALSYDEEVGCLAAPALAEALAAELPRPSALIVGEPTNMELVTAHKGVTIFRVTVTGHEAHSSLTHLGASAIMEAVPILAALRELGEALERGADVDSPFLPKGPSLTIGLLQGGTAGNILARECSFLGDLRAPPGYDGAQVLAPIAAMVESLDRSLSRRFEGAGASIEMLCDVPPLRPDPEGEAATLVRRLTGSNAPGVAVAYGAEAGYFQRAGFSTVICGPGSIEQAHQPDEYIEMSQIHLGCAFISGLARTVGAE